MTSARQNGEPAAWQALQTALAAEHAAVFGYGVLGAQVSGERQNLAQDAWNAHRAARDRLRGMLRAAGAAPTPAAPDYALPGSVTDPESAVRLAVRLEERVAGAYAELVAAADAGRRRFAALQMRECALRATRWRGGTVPFPGLPRNAMGTGGRSSPSPRQDPQ